MTPTPPLSPEIPAEDATPVAPVAFPSRVDAPLRTLFGLLVLWGSLLLIFTAHRRSQNQIVMDVAGNRQETLQRTVAQTVGPRGLLLLPYSINLPGASPRAAIESIAGAFGFSLEPEGLKRLGKEPKGFEFQDLPLYKAIHLLIDNPSIGYAFQGKTLRLFELQKNEFSRQLHFLDWAAEVELGTEPLLVFPSADSDIWFSVHMIRDADTPDNPWRTVRVELWQGADCQNAINATLDETGKAQLSMSTRQVIAFAIERKGQPDGTRSPGRHLLQLYYQTVDDAAQMSQNQKVK